MGAQQALRAADISKSRFHRGNLRKTKTKQSSEVTATKQHPKRGNAPLIALKAETRTPKPERSPNSEIRIRDRTITKLLLTAGLSFCLRPSDFFRISAFGFRISTDGPVH